MNKSDNLKKLDIELDRIDIPKSLICYYLLGVSIVFGLIIYTSISEEPEFSFSLIIIINAFTFSILLPVLYVSRKKNKIVDNFSNTHDLKCMSCNKTPDVSTIHRAYRIDFCPFCELKYKP